MAKKKKTKTQKEKLSSETCLDQDSVYARKDIYTTYKRSINTLAYNQIFIIKVNSGSGWSLERQNIKSCESNHCARKQNNKNH